MRRIDFALLAASILFSIVLMSQSHLCYALPGPKIWLDPSDNVFYYNQTSVGHRFNVTVWVENATNVSAAQISIEFNASIINVTRWFEPKNDAQYIFYNESTTALPTPPEVTYNGTFPEHTFLQVSVLPFPPPPDQEPFNGTGKICILEFNITGGPPPLTSVLHLRNSTDFPRRVRYTYLLNVNGSEIPNVTLEHGSYVYIPEYSPVLAISLFASMTVIAVATRKKLVGRLLAQ